MAGDDGQPAFPEGSVNVDATPPPHVVVLVLGDVGRSPRMQYHAQSLIENGCKVTLVGYSGEALIPSLEEKRQRDDDALRVVRFQTWSPPELPLPLYLVLRLLGLVWAVYAALWKGIPRAHGGSVPTTDAVLVQNPPSAPTLLVSYLYCRWLGTTTDRRPRLVVDWHNLGFTMFGLGEESVVVKLARSYEMHASRLADVHLCVTSALKSWLADNFGLEGDNVRVLRDRPADLFQPTGVAVEHELMVRLRGDFISNCRRIESQFSDDGTVTPFTELVEEGVAGTKTARLRKDRPALVVSSTSWTPDEDFSLLLEALKKLEKMATAHNAKIEKAEGEGNGSERSTVRYKFTPFPEVIVIVTGKGAGKQKYDMYIRELNESKHVSLHCLWLEPEDYPRLLGCADVGVSLHTSTSGVDLPMKVLDMFGCGVPVCAMDFHCLDELVENRVNGMVFGTSDTLSEELFNLLSTLPDAEAHSHGKLAHFKEAIEGMKRWRENWNENAKEMILGAAAKGWRSQSVDKED